MTDDKNTPKKSGKRLNVEDFFNRGAAGDGSSHDGIGPELNDELSDIDPIRAAVSEQISQVMQVTTHHGLLYATEFLSMAKIATHIEAGTAYYFKSSPGKSGELDSREED